ncbi:MAG: hypothetical protein SGARI_008134 [Bacillariaceae sp.]
MDNPLSTQQAINQLLLHTAFEGKLGRLSFALERLDHAMDKDCYTVDTFLDRKSAVANKLVRSILYAFRRAEGFKIDNVPAGPGFVYAEFAQTPEQWKEAYLRDVKDAIHSLVGVVPRVELKNAEWWIYYE